MESGELRIGNIVKTDKLMIGGIAYTDGYMAITSYGIHLMDEGSLDTEPIPLTEEWFIKLGFEFDKISFCIDKYIFMIGLYKDNTFHLVNGYDISNKVIEVKYVHQLQNLHYALTGEELTIKE